MVRERPKPKQTRRYKMNSAELNKIADELMGGCPDESFDDHKKIADAIRAGKSFDEICGSTEIEQWPDTYIWVKTELGE